MPRGLLPDSMERVEPAYVTGDDFSKRARLAAYAGFAAFVLIAILVEAHALVGVDTAVMLAKSATSSGFLFLWSQAVGIALSAEFSIVYTAVAVFLLVGLGLRAWALAPAAWLFGTAVEGTLKLLIHQPRIPPEFIISSNYPLTTVTFPGSFPSGHAIRTAFLFVFLAVVLWTGGGGLRRTGAVVLMVVAVLACYARVYMGQHWASDVVAGAILGTSIALLVAPKVAQLVRQRGRVATRPR